MKSDELKCIRKEAVLAIILIYYPGISLKRLRKKHEKS
jgi:hypothetical protein